MPPIATIGTVVRVTPGDEIQIVYAPGNYEFIDDRTPFIVRIQGVMEEADLIGVYGKVVDGHQRYLGLHATLLVRSDNSDWRRDNRSAANFKIGRSIAVPNGKHPFFHPGGTDVEGFPVIVRYGSLDSRIGNESEINSAMGRGDEV